MLGIMSGPTALDIFRLDKSFSTPLDSIIMFLMNGIFLFDKSGRMLSFTLVNTDWNCSTKMSAFPLESDIKFPFCFKGDTPISLGTKVAYRAKTHIFFTRKVYGLNFV